MAYIRANSSQYLKERLALFCSKKYCDVGNFCQKTCARYDFTPAKPAHAFQNSPTNCNVYFFKVMNVNTFNSISNFECTLCLSFARKCRKCNASTYYRKGSGEWESWKCSHACSQVGGGGSAIVHIHTEVKKFKKRKIKSLPFWKGLHVPKGHFLKPCDVFLPLPSPFRYLQGIGNFARDNIFIF